VESILMRGVDDGQDGLFSDVSLDARVPKTQTRALNVTPHVAQNLTRRGGSAIDARSTRHPGYAISQRTRKRIEECLGWAKGVGPMSKTTLRGVARVDFQFVLTMAAYNLIRLRGLLEPAPT
jgi:hypothetical protein